MVGPNQLRKDIKMLLPAVVLYHNKKQPMSDVETPYSEKVKFYKSSIETMQKLLLYSHEYFMHKINKLPQLF